MFTDGFSVPQDLRTDVVVGIEREVHMTTAQSIEPTSTVKDLAPAATGSRPRLDSIDILRGLVIIFMALDHTKGHFWKGGFNPLDPDVTTFGAYMTRWITHFCAPTFCFLMGTGSYLAGQRGKTPLQLFWFLFSLGVWLMVLEFTVVKYVMFLQFDLHNWAGIVYWSLGSCLIFLSLMVFFPPRVVGLIGLVMILGHNLFDGIKADSLGIFRPFWITLHEGGKVELAEGVNLLVAYPLVPWIGVVSAGYAFGAIYGLSPERRQKIMLRLGLGLTIGFLVLRGLNVYGDPFPWTPRATGWRTALSFLNTHKYPPSLLFLMMTLGPALMFLSYLEKHPLHGRISSIILTYGRVPLFFWVMHWYVIKGVAMLSLILRGYSPEFMYKTGVKAPDGVMLELPWVYFWTFVVVAILYYPCRWFGGVKARNKNVWWLSYL